MTIRDLKPTLIWTIFDQITKVPRPSKKEARIRKFLLDFAKEHNIDAKTDAVGNVVMSKPASPGKEDAPGVILQGHMDMVCESNIPGFDFDNNPITTVIDGEWVHADGTTLGADNGIGMAASLAVLVDDSLVHGPIEALFTVDEETGMTGADNLGEGMMTGSMLINLDSEDDGLIFVGCAGGIVSTKPKQHLQAINSSVSTLPTDVAVTPVATSISDVPTPTNFSPAISSRSEQLPTSVLPKFRAATSATPSRATPTLSSAFPLPTKKKSASNSTSSSQKSKTNIRLKTPISNSTSARKKRPRTLSMPKPPTTLSRRSTVLLTELSQ